MFDINVVDLFKGIGSLAKDLRQAITGDLPPDKKAEIEIKITQLEEMARQGQLQINMMEAQHKSIFVAGWRPAIGWAGAFCIAYNALAPLIHYFVSIFGVQAVPPPKLDMGQLLPIIMGMLGLGGMRSWEKARGVQHRH